MAMDLSGVRYLRSKVPHFRKLHHERGESFHVQSFHAHGYIWVVTIYPRGDTSSARDVEHVSVRISLVGFDRIHTAEEGIDTVEYSIQLGSKRVVRKTSKPFTPSNHTRKHSDLIPRQEILDPEKEYLDAAGTLFICVALKVHIKAPEPWRQQPNKRLKTNLAKMLDAPKFSDVTFMVAGEEFQLHRCILATNVPTLCDLCAKDPNQIITLDDVDADSFVAMIRHVYTGEDPKIEDSDKAKSLLLLADRFNCCSAKLLAESLIVEKYLVESNAAEFLVFADSHSCALLKEAAMQACVDHVDAVMATEGWAKVKESPDLMEELFIASNREKVAMDNVDQMSVGELRDQLLEKNENIDGSREMLAKRLKGCENCCE